MADENGQTGEAVEYVASGTIKYGLRTIADGEAVTAADFAEDPEVLDELLACKALIPRAEWEARRADETIQQRGYGAGIRGGANFALRAMGRGIRF